MSISLSAPRDLVTPTPRKQNLSREQRLLLEQLQRIRYGCIHRLHIRGGQPFFSDGLVWTRLVKISGENKPHPARSLEDFSLKRELIELFRQFSVLGDGEITNLEVRDGLPISFEVTEKCPK